MVVINSIDKDSSNCAYDGCITKSICIKGDAKTRIRREIASIINSSGGHWYRSDSCRYYRLIINNDCVVDIAIEKDDPSFYERHNTTRKKIDKLYFTILGMISARADAKDIYTINIHEDTAEFEVVYKDIDHLLDDIEPEITEESKEDFHYAE